MPHLRSRPPGRPPKLSRSNEFPKSKEPYSRNSAPTPARTDFGDSQSTKVGLVSRQHRMAATAKDVFAKKTTVQMGRKLVTPAV